MNREETREAAEVMLHFANGGEVEVDYQHLEEEDWNTVCNPIWAWHCYVYRKAPPKPVKKYVGVYRKGEPHGAVTYYTTQAHPSEQDLRDTYPNLDTYLVQIIEVEEPAE